MLLHEVDKPGSDIEDYVSQLDSILLNKMELIGLVRQRLIDFYTHLKMEENLQKLYQHKGSTSIMNGNNMGGNDPDSNVLLLDSVLDDFDQNMMDEANINCPDEFSAGAGGLILGNSSNPGSNLGYNNQQNYHQQQQQRR